MQSLIIEKPLLVPAPSRFGWALVTGFFWMVWVYLWLPLLTVVAWLSGINLFGKLAGQTAAHELREFGQLVVIYAAVICIMGGSLLTWARIEFLRFRNVNRRSRPEPVSIVEVAQYAGVPVEELSRWAQSKRVVIHHDAHGRVTGGVAGLGDAVLPDGAAAPLQAAA